MRFLEAESRSRGVGPHATRVVFARAFLGMVLFALAPAGTAAAQQTPAVAPAPDDTLPVDPQVRTGLLDNGLRYYVRANARPEDRAELRLVVNAGSVLEDSTQRGLAHFIEHMAFNGTKNFPKTELVSYLESIGMRFGADLNAYTSFDETVYMLTVPTDSGNALETGVQILEDWAHNQLLDPAEVARERGVVIEEWRLGQGAAARMRDRLFPVLFKGSRYAERLPIGSKDVLESFDPAELRRFYERWYRPDLMAVVAVGDFDPARVEALIRERFGGIPRPPSPADRPLYPVPDNPGTLVSVVSDREATNSQATVYFKQPVRATRTAADYRTDLIGHLYNAMLNSRLSELAQTADPPFLGAGSSEGRLVRSKDAYILGVGVPQGGIRRGLEAALTEAERVARHGFTSTELERQKANLLRAYETAYAEREKSESPSYAGEYVQSFLEGEAIPGIETEYALVQRLLPGIPLDEVNALSQRWMTDGNRVLAAQLPDKAGVEVPSEQSLLAVFDSVDHKDIAPYQDVVASAELVPDPPAPGSIVSRRTWDAVGTTEWRLSNGVRVLLKPTTFKDDEVLFSAFSPGGASLASDDTYLSALLSPTAVRAGGAGDMSLVQLQKALAGKAVQVQPSISDLEEGLSGGGSPKDLETMFQLLYLYFTAPRKDTVAFASYQSRLKASMANRGASPQAAFQDTLQVTLTRHAPRERPITAQRIDDWKLDESLAFYRDRFADASDFTFVFVGSFEPASIEPLVLRYIAGLPSTRRVENWRDTGIRPPEGVIKRVVHKGIEPKSQTAIVFTGPFDYSRVNRYHLASLADVLEIQLRDALREDMGGTYGVQVSQSTAKSPWPDYSFTIAFGADPARLEELATAAWTVIHRVQTEGVDSATLEKVKETQRREHETALEQNGYWLGQLSYAARIGEDPGAFLAYPALVDSLTSADISEAAKTFLRDDNYVRVSLLPESKN